MARIQITIDIPKDGPAQVSITTDHDARKPAKAIQRGGKPLAISQITSPENGDLRATREARGWTQRELAERIGCSPNTVALIERGKARMTDRIRGKIQKAGIVLVSAGGNGVEPVAS